MQHGKYKNLYLIEIKDTYIINQREDRLLPISVIIF